MPPPTASLPLRPDGLHAVRDLAAGELPALADQIRRFLVEKVCATGGHLGPNLGMVEVTLALHRVFDSPRDALIFDTGHQAYVHKLLTGRDKEFDTLRQAGGLSGYPSRAESVHDWVENSHASTSLSYADGLAKARALNGENQRAVVAVIGDGALTGGMALEALNNIGGAPTRPVIIVLNDNGRSYAPTTGALAQHLAALKQGGGAVACQNLFTELGFTYFGPVDGHNTGEIEGVLRRSRALHRPVVVHVMTVKGKGYAPAEQDEADCLHAVGTVDAATGRPAAGAAKAQSWTRVFGQALVEVAAVREDIVAVTAAMLRPTGLHPMAARFPERVFDVGIAEQHAVTSAAGLAMGGFHPVVAIYATFLNRAVDQVLMDVALHRLPVTFVLDRAGITGPDGPSHHGMWDLSLLAAVPGLRVAAPRDATRMRSLLRAAVDMQDGPTALRLPKATVGPDIEAAARMDGLDILHRSPHRPLDVLLIPVGPLAQAAIQAAALLRADGLGVTVADPRWVIPVNPALPGLAARHRLTLTIEDNIRSGGVGSVIAQACRNAHVTTPVSVLGLPRAFLPHGPRTDLLAEAGLDAAGIARAVREELLVPPHPAAPAHHQAFLPPARRVR
ncbi:1-deoxy-D-xylulose-5-phosphate synthase [Streptomyces sp. NRRL B-1347]|uniref:1-deoxy-D-xylulose-5-phosphate synthase n=1 Tax=Streptomyces sp. NRRL B-1347 TaxID=1476877 RepID=UPI0006916BA1|nr:1-deoxy-D-xylulose-5-phosphate synthase [Streptomyces sp. NRRL B-1347]